MKFTVNFRTFFLILYTGGKGGGAGWIFEFSEVNCIDPRLNFFCVVWRPRIGDLTSTIISM